MASDNNRKLELKRKRSIHPLPGCSHRLYKVGHQTRKKPPQYQGNTPWHFQGHVNVSNTWHQPSDLVGSAQVQDFGKKEKELERNGFFFQVTLNEASSLEMPLKNVFSMQLPFPFSTGCFLYFDREKDIFYHSCQKYPIAKERVL